MLTAFLRAFRTPDLRKKLLFTLLILAIFRLGSTIQSPGVSTTNVHAWPRWPAEQRGVPDRQPLQRRGTAPAVGLRARDHCPYITSSIIIQLLGVVIPRLERLKDEGQSGRGQAHAVHPLPHGGAGGAPGGPASWRWRVPADCSATAPSRSSRTRRSSPSRPWSSA